MTFPCLLCPLLTSATRSGNLAVPSVPNHRTRRRSPEVSSTAFRAQPPNLRPAPLMDVDFAIICPLVRRKTPRIRFLSIGSRVCSPPPSHPPSRGRPCASLTPHPPHVGGGAPAPPPST